MFDTLADRLARLIAGYTLDVREDQLVIIEASTDAEELTRALCRHIAQAGGIPEVRLQFPGQEYLLMTELPLRQLSRENPLERWAVEHASALVRVISDPNPYETEHLASSLVQLRRSSRQGIFLKALERMNRGDFRICSVPWPTNGMAQASRMAREDFAAALKRGCLLDREDPAAAWAEVGKRQQRVVDYLAGVDTLRFVAPGTDLTVKVGGRTWINCCGKGDLPDGEVFTAPWEDSAEGMASISFPARHCNGVTLEFRKGRVVAADAAAGREHLLSTLEQPGADRLGEVAIGLNQGLQEHIGNILFDEKMGGTMHIALGAAFPSSGGKNQSAVHWDLLIDLRQDGRIEADGRLILEEGRLLI